MLLPDAYRPYYEKTNAMHCGAGEGGSKFVDPRVRSIFDVVGMAPELAQRVRERKDDRERLLAAGAAESAFLPAIKGPEAPSGLPEALYFLVDHVEGRLGVVPVSEVSDETPVMVRREKGHGRVGEEGYAPVSLTVMRGRSMEDMPHTQIATIVVGRDYDAQGNRVSDDVVWTVFPGLPSRPMRYAEYPWTQDLDDPNKIRVMSMREAKEKFSLKPDDTVKVVPGDMNAFLSVHTIVK